MSEHLPLGTPAESEYTFAGVHFAQADLAAQKEPAQMFPTAAALPSFIVCEFAACSVANKYLDARKFVTCFAFCTDLHEMNKTKGQRRSR